MLIKSLKGLLAVAALGLATGCSTASPCGAPGRLCAPVQANTSAPPAVQPLASSMPVAAGQAVGEFRPQARPVVTAQPATTRIALLLPLQSETLGPAAEAIRAGFMAAWERDRAGVEVNVVPTPDTAAEALATYTRAAARNDIVVGPLGRAAVGAVAASSGVKKPTFALNHPEPRVALPRPMLVIGLSIEDEARQVAAWAASEHPRGRALVLASPGAWQRRLAGAFDARWAELGRSSQLLELPALDGVVDGSALAELKTRLEIDPPDLLFAALDAGQLRQVRGALGTAIPCYGASSVNPGRAPGAAVAELDGVRLLDLPWQVQPDHPAVMVYPRPLANGQSLDMDRLYALGIDAFRVAREIALHPGAPFRLDGVTGRLAVDPAVSTFERREAATVYQDGAFQPLPDERSGR
jgi:outer membrane PBP1 activator LpoA protein